MLCLAYEKSLEYRLIMTRTQAITGVIPNVIIVVGIIVSLLPAGGLVMV
jgi:hypothetical protein